MMKAFQTWSFVGLLLLPMMVWGQPGGPPPWAGQAGGRGGPVGWGIDLWKYPEIRKKLNLTDEQVQRIREKKLELETRRIDIRARMEIARLQLENLLESDEIDHGAIEKQVEELGNLHKEQIRSVVDQKLALREILTPEQLAKIEKFLAQRKSRKLKKGQGGVPPHLGRTGRGKQGSGPAPGPRGHRGRGKGRGFGKGQPEAAGSGPGGPPPIPQKAGAISPPPPPEPLPDLGDPLEKAIEP